MSQSELIGVAALLNLRKITQFIKAGLKSQNDLKLRWIFKTESAKVSQFMHEQGWAILIMDVNSYFLLQRHTCPR